MSRQKPDARTIGPTLTGVREWKNLGFNTAVPCTISNKHSEIRLHGAVVQIVGPGESYIKKAKILNRVLIINNKTLMVRITRMVNSSKKYKVGNVIEIKPKYLKPFF